MFTPHTVPPVFTFYFSDSLYVLKNNSKAKIPFKYPLDPDSILAEKWEDKTIKYIIKKNCPVKDMLIQANQNFPRNDVQKCLEKLQYLYKK